MLRSFLGGLVFLGALTQSVAQSLPQLPLSLQPCRDATHLALQTARELPAVFAKYNYTLAALHAEKTLPALYAQNLPVGLNNLPASEKATSFIRLLLPTIYLVNAQVLKIRDALQQLSAKPSSEWTLQQQDWFARLLKQYQATDMKALLTRVGIIPPAMALAQGILESGWGTSYFAVQGNALYGLHYFPQGSKKFLVAQSGVKVAAFDSLYTGTAAYMLNLNSNPAYKDLRLLRLKLRAEKQLNGLQLVRGLSLYSTRGEAYVNSLRSVIQDFSLSAYEGLSFSANTKNTCLHFNHNQ